MSVTNATRDGNFVPVIQGVRSDTFTQTVDVAVNKDTHALLVEPQPTNPLQTLNASYSIDYNAAGDVITVRKIINGTTYTKTLSNSDTTVASTKTISVWS